MKIRSVAHDRLTGWDEKTGAVGALAFGNALEFWAYAQDRAVTCHEAALAFNVRPELVAHVIASHPWMHLDGATIELDATPLPQVKPYELDRAL